MYFLLHYIYFTAIVSSYFSDQYFICKIYDQLKLAVISTLKNVHLKIVLSSITYRWLKSDSKGVGLFLQRWYYSYPQYMQRKDKPGI